MLRIDEEFILELPVEKIFDYVHEPRNLPEIWSSLIEVKDIQALPNGGYRVRWFYKMVGMRFEGTAENTKLLPNHLIVLETKGGISSTITWTFRSLENMNNATRVTFTIEYKIPVPILGKIAEPIIRKINHQEITLMTTNLQVRLMNLKPQNTLSRILLHR
ncbi:SRPBCC family protein [Chloroflexota bacterium]